MGVFDKVKKLASPEKIDKAKQLAGKNADKISGAVDKATNTIDKRTKGKYRDKLDRVSDTVDEKLREVQRDTDQPAQPDQAEQPDQRDQPKGPGDAGPGSSDR